MASKRKQDLDRLYNLLDDVRLWLNGYQKLSESTGRGVASHGVYFFFENGEVRDDGHTPRVTRVGTHALKAGAKSTLWQRLRQHRGTIRGNNPGAGNHRGSVFRHHVGSALYTKSPAKYPKVSLDTWLSASADTIVRAAEVPLEKKVSSYVRAMPFLWVPVLDPPGPYSHRAQIESGIVRLLSNRDRPHIIDPPSREWLGRHAHSAEVRESGLWNVNHTAGPDDNQALDLLEKWVEYSREETV